MLTTQFYYSLTTAYLGIVPATTNKKSEECDNIIVRLLKKVLLWFILAWYYIEFL